MSCFFCVVPRFEPDVYLEKSGIGDTESWRLGDLENRGNGDMDTRILSINRRESPQVWKLSHWLTRMLSNGISPRADQKAICRQRFRFRRCAFLTRTFLPLISRNEPETTVNRSLSNSLTSSSKRRSHTSRIIRIVLIHEYLKSVERRSGFPWASITSGRT